MKSELNSSEMFQSYFSQMQIFICKMSWGDYKKAWWWIIFYDPLSTMLSEATTQLFSLPINLLVIFSTNKFSFVYKMPENYEKCWSVFPKDRDCVLKHLVLSTTRRHSDQKPERIHILEGEITPFWLLLLKTLLKPINLNSCHLLNTWHLIDESLQLNCRAPVFSITKSPAAPHQLILTASKRSDW